VQQRHPAASSLVTQWPKLRQGDVFIRHDDIRHDDSLDERILNRPNDQTSGRTLRLQHRPATAKFVDAEETFRPRGEKSTVRDDCANKPLEFRVSRAITTA